MKWIAVVGACTVLGACGSISNGDAVNALTGGPTTVATPDNTPIGNGPGAAPGLDAESASCPQGGPPAFRVGTSQGRVDFTWAVVTDARGYLIAIDRLQNDRWTPEAEITADANRYEWYPGRAGQFRARVRATTGCDRHSDWSAPEEFSFGSDEAVPAGAAQGGAPASPQGGGPLPLLRCGSIEGTYVADLSTVLFTAGRAGPVAHAVSMPPGSYRASVEIYDSAHRAGHQREQTREQVSVSLTLANGSVVDVGTTPDLAEAATSAVAQFTVTTGAAASGVRVAHAAPGAGSPNSVHGVCIAFK